MNFDKEFDASGMACPLPVIKTKKALGEIAAGQILRVITTDPGSVQDIASLASQTGHQLLESGSEGNRFFFYLKKKS